MECKISNSKPNVFNYSTPTEDFTQYRKQQSTLIAVVFNSNVLNPAADTRMLWIKT